mmetsp:Transcript_24608/g.34359  ORF Transcript_24608/g.34359 Transcript_24608/m.34359 type:complete len:139 (+) Transcript_24608:191-607(+)
MAFLGFDFKTRTFVRYRVRKGVQEMETSTSSEKDTEEDTFLQRLRAEKESYKKLFLQLKELKQEIEHLQHGLERARRQLKRDFERWWNEANQAPKAETQTSTNSRINSLKQTGDPSADAEIAAFYRARDEMMKNTQVS